MTDTPTLPVAYVEWVDSGVVSGGWDDRQEAIERAGPTLGLPIRSAGLLVAQNEDGVLLALGHNTRVDDVVLVLAIPRSVIQRMDLWDPTGGKS